MELNKIEGLLEKYDKGATTLIEEAQLRDYFSQEIIPYHLESYKQLFSYFESDAKQFAEIPIMLRIQFPKKTRWYASVAAAILIMVTVSINQTIKKDELFLSRAELRAYNETLKAFDLISNQMNKGYEALSSLRIIESSFEKGKKNINMLSEFNNSTNKIFKLNKK